MSLQKSIYVADLTTLLVSGDSPNPCQLNSKINNDIFSLLIFNPILTKFKSVANIGALITNMLSFVGTICEEKLSPETSLTGGITSKSLIGDSYGDIGM